MLREPRHNNACEPRNCADFGHSRALDTAYCLSFFTHLFLSAFQVQESALAAHAVCWNPLQGFGVFAAGVG